MPGQPDLFHIGQLIQARLEFVRAARGLPPGTERNQKRQIARSLKRLIILQARNNSSPLPIRRKLFTHRSSSLNERLLQHAKSLRKRAEEMPAGIQQEHLLRKAFEAEEAIILNQQLSIPAAAGAKA
jgi:hypothetical protein